MRRWWQRCAWCSYEDLEHHHGCAWAAFLRVCRWSETGVLVVVNSPQPLRPRHNETRET